jgi:class 3 adenylate cyclase
VIRAGDFYGNSVNLASRVTGIARPGSVLCTEEVRDAALDQFDWSFAGKHRLKGVGSQALYRARRLKDDSEKASDKHSSTGRRGEGSTKPRADRRRRRGSR